MLFLLMIDTPEEKRKFVILCEKYKYLMQKVAMDVLHDSFLAEDAVYNAFISVAYNLDKLDEFEDVPTKWKNLDSETTETVMELLCGLNRRQDTCVISVSHSQSIVEKADEVLELKKEKLLSVECNKCKSVLRYS